MDPPTSVSKGSEQYPEPKRSKTTPKKLILEALKEDGSIDMELLKGISRGCLEVLQERHAKGKCQSFIQF